MSDTASKRESKANKNILRYLTSRIEQLKKENESDRALDDKNPNKNMFIQISSRAIMELEHVKAYLEVELEND